MCPNDRHTDRMRHSGTRRVDAGGSGDGVLKTGTRESEQPAIARRLQRHEAGVGRSATTYFQIVVECHPFMRIDDAPGNAVPVDDIAGDRGRDGDTVVSAPTPCDRTARRGDR